MYLGGTNLGLDGTVSISHSELGLPLPRPLSNRRGRTGSGSARAAGLAGLSLNQLAQQRADAFATFANLEKSKKKNELSASDVDV